MAEIHSIKLIYFSPTGTTRRVVEGIAQGLGAFSKESLDLTPPDTGILELPVVQDDLAIIGLPVYGGRLPVDAIGRLRRLRGHNTPAVIVVVYGNRAYEDALLELRDLAADIGFVPLAAAAFIGEHSYSTANTPIAVGRPDTEDMVKAGDFAKIIRQKFGSPQAIPHSSPLPLPGNFPYKEARMLANISPVTQESLCVKCGTCISVCPTLAISNGGSVRTDPGTCIRCCACVKSCPAGARAMDDPLIREVARQLSRVCGSRKEPEIFT